MLVYMPPQAPASIPVIDLGWQKGNTARAIHRACRESGFFHIANHGEPLGLERSAGPCVARDLRCLCLAVAAVVKLHNHGSLAAVPAEAGAHDSKAEQAVSLEISQPIG
jgi:hypothetical protein